MVIDLRKCSGCDACTIGCKAENQLPPGVVYRPVIDEEIGTYPNVRRRFLPRPCMQCEKPPCTPVCPVGATWRRSDGVVAMDYEKCIGCRYCIVACPYSARTADEGAFYTEGTPAVQPYEEQVSPGVQRGLSQGRRRLAGRERAQVPLLPAPARGRAAPRLRHDAASATPRTSEMRTIRTASSPS